MFLRPSINHPLIILLITTTYLPTKAAQAEEELQQHLKLLEPFSAKRNEALQDQLNTTEDNLLAAHRAYNKKALIADAAIGAGTVLAAHAVYNNPWPAIFAANKDRFISGFEIIPALSAAGAILKPVAAPITCLAFGFIGWRSLKHHFQDPVIKQYKTEVQQLRRGLESHRNETKDAIESHFAQTEREVNKIDGNLKSVIAQLDSITEAIRETKAVNQQQKDVLGRAMPEIQNMQNSVQHLLKTTQDQIAFMKGQPQPNFSRTPPQLLKAKKTRWAFWKAKKTT